MSFSEELLRRTVLFPYSFNTSSEFFKTFSINHSLSNFPKHRAIRPS